MAYVNIVGASGYTGQETLDRVLAHPELELVAVGSDSLAGRPATALDPRLNRNGGRRVPVFITNEAALSSEADVTFLCLPHEQAAAVEPPKRGVVIDLSGAHRLQDAGLYDEWYGFSHPRPAELGEWVYGLPELVDVVRSADRQSGVLRHGRVARRRPDPRRDRSRRRRRRREVGHDRRGAVAQGRHACRLRARERLAVQGRRPSARARDRPAARLPRLVHAASPARAARPDRHLLRPLHRRRPAGAPRRRTTPRATSSPCCPKG